MQSMRTTEKVGGKTSSFKMRREKVRTECHSSWIPLWRERRNGWAEEKGGRGGKEKIKPRVKDTKEKGVNHSQHMSSCEYEKDD